MTSRVHVLVWPAILLLSGRPATLAAQTPEQSNVTGTWRFNAKESDNPRELLPRPGTRAGQDSVPPGTSPAGAEGGRGGRGGMGGMGGGRRGGGMGGGMGGRGGMGGQGAGRPAGAGANSGMRQTMDLALVAPTLLDLALTDSAIRVVETDSFMMRPRVPDPDNPPEPIIRRDTLSLALNYKKVKRADEGGDIEYRAHMEAGRLTIEEKVGGGGRLTETYFRSRDGHQLFVVVKVEMSTLPKPVEYRRIYDPEVNRPS